MKRENGKRRLLELRRILLEETDEKNGLSMSELLTRLDGCGCTAERKSVYDDLRVLGENELDIRMTRNPAKYSVISREFELTELKILVDAVISSKFITAKKSASLVEKLTRLAGPSERRGLRHKLAAPLKAVNERVFYTIDSVCEAESTDRQLSFRLQTVVPSDDSRGYRTELRRAGAEYIVSPLGLIWDNENYYLVAYEERDGIHKHYRIDRMIDVKVIDMPRKLPEKYVDFDLTKYARSTFGMFGGTETKVTLEFSDDLISVVVDRFGDVVVRRAGEGIYSTTVSVNVGESFYSWVFMFGGKLRIVSPNAAVRGFRSQLESCESARQYTAYKKSE